MREWLRTAADRNGGRRNREKHADQLGDNLACNKTSAAAVAQDDGVELELGGIGYRADYDSGEDDDVDGVIDNYDG